ncbi:hypothetical protein, partial [Sansalvadorimonas verongulae]|uniref:hypothetical protein n=1 Tax=Sansalvadorimonas verongulae TaxID=2172824 RepID=UPI0018AD1C62
DPEPSAPFEEELDQPEPELPSESRAPKPTIIITDESMVADKQGENSLHRIVRYHSPDEIEAIFTHNSETIKPDMLTVTNLAGQSPLDILIERGIKPAIVFPWLLYSLTGAVANDLVDQNLFGELSWQQLYDFARLSAYVEKDKKLKQILEMLEPVFFSA